MVKRQTRQFAVSVSVCVTQPLKNACKGFKDKRIRGSKSENTFKQQTFRVRCGK